MDVSRWCSINPRWLVLGCGGMLVGISVSCSGESPSSPSELRQIGMPLEFSSALGSSAGGIGGSVRADSDGSFTMDVGRDDDGTRGSERGDGPKQRGRGKERKRQYCKSLPPGHEHYERCQAWLSSERGDGPKRRGRGEEQRRQYCQSLPPGHEHYERCQTWLSSGKSKRGRQGR